MIINKLLGFRPDTRQPVFKGIRQEPKTMLREYGEVVRERGYFKDKRLDIYNAYDLDGKLANKLYYLSDRVGNWIKSKLVFFDDTGKKYKIIRSEAGCYEDF